MQISVYSWEHHERNKSWRIIFSLVLIVLFILTLFWPLIAHWGDGNIFSWDNISNVIILLLMVSWYIYWSHHYDWNTTFMRTTEKWIVIWSKEISRNLVKWFVVEADKKQWTIKNLVVVTERDNHIHSIIETDEDTIILFVEELKKFTPRLSNFHQSFFEIIIRKCKF